MLRMGVGLLGVLLVGFPVALADPGDDCNQTRDINRQLRGCTAYIQQNTGGPQNLATAYQNRANVYAMQGKYQLAFADFASAILLDPDNPLAFYNRGNAYLDTQQYGLAIASFTRALEIERNFALAYLNRGLARERSGQLASAKEDYRRVLELDPSATTAQQRLINLQRSR